MSLRHLQTLIAIVERGSFAQAADSLGITQSAVSMQMKALEDELQVVLFDRSKRPPAINALGISLTERAREIVVLYDGLRAAAAAELRGRLRLGVIPSASVRILPEALVALRALHPGVQVAIESGLSSQLARRVAGGELDAAVITEPPPPRANLACRTVAREALIVIAPPAAAGSPDAELLSTLPFIRFNRRTGVGRVIDAGLRDRRIKVQETMELDSLEAILQMVSHGLGVAVVPEMSLGEGGAGRVHAVPFGNPPLQRAIGLVTPETPRTPEVVDALFERLRQAAR